MDTASKTKRIRIVVRQSRNGCYTCKSRRVKCDERKPFCLRCERSKQSCEGYRDQWSSSSDLTDDGSSNSAEFQPPFRRQISSESNPILALSTHPNGDQVTERFVYLACAALQCGEATKSGGCHSVWAYLVPQFSCSVPVVAFALASLGAALEASMLLRSATVSANTMAARQYGKAIREIQREVLRATSPSEPLLLSCLILACAEVVQWRETNALTHIQGSMALLRSRCCSKYPSPSLNESVDAAQQLDDEWANVFTPKDELDLLSVQVDLQIASFALGLPPQLSLINLKYLQSMPPSQRGHSDLELEVIQAVHSCYRVAYSISEYKYLSREFLPPALAFQQTRHISQLAVCLRKIERYIRPGVPTGHLSEQSYLSPRLALILRSQCLASLIYLSMISNSHECGYDEYAPYFEQIVADGEILLSSTSAKFEAFDQFSIGLGILQPLFLTAIKYRDSSYRRRAVWLLNKGGREGPFHGRLLSAVALRAAEAEETYAKHRGDGLVQATDIAESVRLHGIGMNVETMIPSGETQIEVTLSRCLDVEAMVRSEEPWRDLRHWDIWTEVVYLR